MVVVRGVRSSADVLLPGSSSYPHIEGQGDSPLVPPFASELRFYCGSHHAHTAKARIFDFSARFNEAAQRYHELSFESVIDEDERLIFLYVSITHASADRRQESSSENIYPRSGRPAAITSPGFAQSGRPDPFFPSSVPLDDASKDATRVYRPTL